MKQFLQVRIDVPSGLGDIAVFLAQKVGAKGVEIRDASTLPPPGGKAPAQGRTHVMARLDTGTNAEQVAALLTATLDSMRGEQDGAADPGFDISFETVDAEDWVRKVREAVQPVRLGKRILVRPTWRTTDPPAGADLIEIVLDPGLAFGTGHHATSALCMELLEELLDEIMDRGERPAVLDVGTGSGLLAITAAKLGAKRCVGVDNDPVAVRVAAENVSSNGVADTVTITADSVDELQGPFDVVVANIHLGVLTEMAPSIATKLPEEGNLVLSGLLEDQAGMAKQAYADQGLVTLGIRQRDGWVAISMKRPEEQT